jgi:Fe-Mn family superoxide dismutase
MHIHHDKHHAAYIKNLNDALAGHEALLSMPVEALIADLSQVPEEVRTKVRNNAGGHANHTFFWQIMGSPSADNKPTGPLAEAIHASYGSLEQFQEKFAASGVGRFGSGWVWLVKKDNALSIMDTPNQDSPLMEGKTPILGLDVWEHAYYLKYKNVRPEYIKAWWNVVNWKEVEKRFQNA